MPPVSHRHVEEPAMLEVRRPYKNLRILLDDSPVSTDDDTSEAMAIEPVSNHVAPALPPRPRPPPIPPRVYHKSESALDK